MNKQYKVASWQLANEIAELTSKIHTMISICTDVILSSPKYTAEVIDISMQHVRVGEFDGRIDGYQLAMAITREADEVCMQLELSEDFEPVTRMATLSLEDKVQILSALETVIKNYKI